MPDEPSGTIEAEGVDLSQSLAYRRFQIWDAIVLIAAIAVGLAFGKQVFFERFPNLPMQPRIRDQLAIYGGYSAAVAGLTALSIAYIPIRLRRPRPSLVQIMSQPGFVACVIASVVSLVVLAIYGKTTRLSSLVGILSIFIGMSIASQWFVLWLSGLWKSEPSWIDRMGRLLGLCWIATPLFLALSFWL